MEFGHLLDYNQYITVILECQVFLREIDEKKTAHVAPMEKSNEKRKNISCITMISISRWFPISIHAPTWGTTSLTRLIMSSAPFFNPRTRVGYDRAHLPRLWPHWFSCSSKYPTGYQT